MSIKRKLKKLQCQTPKEDSEFCDCDNQIKTIEPGDPQPPETCEMCCKPLFIIAVTSREMRGEN